MLNNLDCSWLDGRVNVLSKINSRDMSKNFAREEPLEVQLSLLTLVWFYNPSTAYIIHF